MRLHVLSPVTCAVLFAACSLSTLKSSAQVSFVSDAVASPQPIVGSTDTSGPLSTFLGSPSMPRILVKTRVVDNGPDAKSKSLAFHTEIEVIATDQPIDIREGFERSFTPREVETSAGTFGDVTRYIQTLAGVVSDNDQRNDFLVRGGNPSENGFVIDNIEIPSINQLALSDSTGGLVSMLDASAVQKFDLHTDAYDSRFDQRLSSIVEISTRPTGDVENHNETEMGVAGTGGSITRPMGHNGSLFASGRASILQYFTNDIGMNGVPIYKNAFFRAEGRPDARNSWWGLSLAGIDSILMNPDKDDYAETNPFTIAYSGWRNTKLRRRQPRSR